MKRSSNLNRMNLINFLYQMIFQEKHKIQEKRKILLSFQYHFISVKLTYGENMVLTSMIK